MKIIDITKELFSAEVYPGDTAPELTRKTTVKDSGFNTSDVNMCLHNGTHIDAPFHVKESGLSVADIPLEKCCGRCAVITVNGRLNLKIMREIRGLSARRVLLRGAKITPVSALALTHLHLDLVGVDVPSVGDKSVHKILIDSGTVVLEGLDLSLAEDGEYTLYAFPMKISGADGAPTRAVLIKEL